MDGWRTIAEQESKGAAFVVVTVAAQRGSVPAVTGAKAIIDADGLRAGTLGGGKVEAKAIREAQAMLAGSGSCELRTWNLQKDVGMTCGGEMTLLFEKVAPAEAWRVVVFGAGHVSQALVRLLATLNCGVEVIDTRPEWLDRLPAGERIRRHVVSAFEDGVGIVTPGDFVVSITQGHSTDRPVLREVLKRFPGIPFLGVIGSAAKRAVLLRELREDGIDADLLKNLVCPLGLPLGGNDPAEIAVSITAQLLERRDARAAGRWPA
ncbi:MAG: xanthine dehydrogenase accessory protein XdhC [Akkermansiaceae bacterium]|nr:xanthine dehydrogenase accessory protein XdhC [Akkermansiaceae bacterium]